ncbi:MAG: GNAT family N-acetyltransferase [Burkholderiales bacterium]|nr:GNAT family N-acetyltransferase [Burkholderiales bacterium]
MHPAIRRIEWDSAAFGRDCFEIDGLDADALQEAARRPGHYSVKVDALASKALLHQHGFYYCDTLIEPFCTRERFTGHPDARARFSRDSTLDAVLAICHGAFRHGRFHRDFHLSAAQADLRYDNWLRQLHAAGNVYGLMFEGQPAGFIAVDGGRLVLHAMAAASRGRGIAKHLWTAVCDDLFRRHAELSSSISAANVAAANLYATLGFRFRQPVDVYHRWTT